MNADLSELLERCRKATGPDRDIDRAIFDTLCGGVFDEATVGKFFRRIRWDAEPIEFTASVDAALALVERCLPGWRYDIHSPRFGTPFEGVLMDGDSASRRIVVGHAPTAPLAILSALLQAIGEQP